MSSTPDPSDLRRFLSAQEPVLAAVEAELRAGRKRTHWMWFVFPQLRGLGHSATARFYGLAGRPEAAAFLGHAVLGPRLVSHVRLALDGPEPDPHALFGTPDDLKFRSCLTLFAALEGADLAFRLALGRFFAGAPDGRTLALLPGDVTGTD